MVQEVEAFGKIIEFPDGMSREDMHGFITKNRHKIDPDYEVPLGDKLNSLSKEYLGVTGDDIADAFKSKQSIADQTEASAAKGENTAAPQVPGAPVRQSTYNKALLNTQDITSDTGIKSRIAKAADEDIKGQANQQELELLRTEALKPSESGFGASAMQTVGRTIKGAGQVGSDFFDVNKDNAITLYGQKLLDDNPTWVKSLGDIKDEPLLAVKEATGNSLGSMAGMIGVGAVGVGITSLAPLTGPAAPIVAAVGQAVQWLGPAAVAALPSYGGIRDAQILKDPKNEADAKSKAIAGIGAAAVGAIEVAFGPQQWAIAMLTKEGRAAMARKFAATTIGQAAVKGAALGAVVEGAEEIVQSPIEQLASYEDPTTKKSLDDTVFSGAMGAIGGSTAGAVTGSIAHINVQRTQRTINKVAEATTVDDAIKAATQPDPTLDDIIAATPTRQEPTSTRQETEVVLPDNTSVKAQWQVVDADTVKASMKEGIAQPRDRTRAASDIQIKSIANAPDYRRLSDSPVMDVGAPVIDMDGNIVAGNGRFEGISQAHEQGTGKEYLAALRADAINKGIDPALIDGIKKPVLVRAITQPIDTRKMAIASNAGGSLQYSALELAKIDAERMLGIENLDVNDLGDIALTPRNLTQLKDSLGKYTAAELGSLVGKGGELSQEGVKRVRNAMLAKAYGSSPVLERLVESTDTDMRNVLGALTKSAGHIIKTKGNTTALLEAVDTYAQLKATGQPVDNFLAQQDAFSEGLSKEAEDILRFVDANARSQKKLTDFIKDGFVEVDTTSDDMFATPQKPLQAVKDERITKLETYLKDSGYDFTVEPASVRDVDALDSAAKAAEKIAKFFKKKVVFVKADGPFSINGVMVPSIADTIFIDIRTKKSLVAVMGHELSHWLEQDKPALYKQLLKSLKKVIKEDATKGYAKKYGIQGATEVELTKEIVGDIMGDNFTEQSFWDKVAKVNPTSFKDVAAAIIKWLKGVILKAKSQGMGSEEWVKDATKAQDILTKAVAQYTGENQSAGTEGGVKFNVTQDPAKWENDKNVMDLYHGGDVEITSLDGRGVYRSVFANTSVSAAESHGDILTKFFVPKDKVLSGWLDADAGYESTKQALEESLVEHPYAAEFMDFDDIYNVVVYEDESVIGEKELSNDDDLMLELQALRADVARKLGYSAVSTRDEHGTSYQIIDSLNIPKFSRGYHGSPHDHDKFDSSKIGTGEGAQAYGWGHYFADSKEVAEYYKDALSKTTRTHVTYKGNKLTDGYLRELRNNGTASEKDVLQLIPNNKINSLKVIDVLNDRMLSSKRQAEIYKDRIKARIADESGGRKVIATYSISDYEANVKYYESSANNYQEFIDNLKLEDERKSGKLYEVELAPEQDEYLLWDRPLSEQSDKVKVGLKGLGIHSSKNPDEMSDLELKGATGGFENTLGKGEATGKKLYKELESHFGSDKKASEYLHSLGIRGIKYLDGSSRHKAYEVVLSTKQGEYARSEFDNKSQAEEYAKDKRAEGFKAEVQFNENANFNYVIFDDKDISITAKFSRAPKYVNIKLIDIDGDEVVWDGDPDKHPGRMLADDAIREVDDRIANLKRLIECLK